MADKEASPEAPVLLCPAYEALASALSQCKLLARMKVQLSLLVPSADKHIIWPCCPFLSSDTGVAEFHDQPSMINQIPSPKLDLQSQCRYWSGK